MIRLRPELILAVLLALLVALGAVFNWVPFKTLMDWGEYLSGR